jgi:glutamate-1-semialdehyde aminotransferase
VFFTGSYFTSAVPMAAALACLKELKAANGIDRMRMIGEKLRDGMLAQARIHLTASIWRHATTGSFPLRTRRRTSRKPSRSPSRRSRRCAGNLRNQNLLR